MSTEEDRIKKLVISIKKKTSLKDEVKITELAKALDTFSNFVLQTYIETKKNESHNIL